MSNHWSFNPYIGLMSHTSYKNNILVCISLQSYIYHEDFSLIRPNPLSIFLHTYEYNLTLWAVCFSSVPFLPICTVYYSYSAFITLWFQQPGLFVIRDWVCVGCLVMETNYSSLKNGWTLSTLWTYWVQLSCPTDPIGWHHLVGCQRLLEHLPLHQPHDLFQPKTGFLLSLSGM